MYRRVFNVTLWNNKQADCILMPDNTAREIVAYRGEDKPVVTQHFGTFGKTIREIWVNRESVLT